jgi:hypothetical protein
MRGAANIWVGALAGYAASRTMDRATTWFYGRQTQGSRDREEQLAPGGTLVQLGRQLGGLAGRDLSDEAAARTGLAVHRTFGMVYGMAASTMIGRGVRPLAAGLAVGGAAWVLVDEGTAVPTFAQYPVESHLRGVVGHGAYGLTAGLLLALVDG